MGSTKSHWVQLLPPKTYKEKYEKLKALIVDRYEGIKDIKLKEYQNRTEELMNLRVLINTMERTTDKYSPWDMSKK